MTTKKSPAKGARAGAGADRFVLRSDRPRVEPDRALLCTLETPGFVTDLAIDDRASIALSICGNRPGTFVWDLATGALLRTFPEEGGFRVRAGQRDFACDPGGKRALLGTTPGLDIHALDTGERLFSLAEEGGAPVLLLVDRRGHRAVAAQASGDILVWDLQRGARLHRLRAHAALPALTLLGERYLVSTGSESLGTTDSLGIPLFAVTARLWDLETGACVRELAREGDMRATAIAHALGVGSAVAVALSHPALDPRTGVTIYSWSWTVTDLSTLETRASSFTRDGKLLPDGRRVVRADPRTHAIEVSDFATGALLHTLSGHSDRVFHLVPHPDGKRLVSGAEDGTVRVWDLDSGARLGTLKGHAGGIAALALSRSGDRIVSAGADGRIRVWDAGAVEAAPDRPGHSARITGLAALPGGRLLSAAADRSLILWDGAAQAPLRTIRTGDDPGVYALALHPDGARALSAGVGEIIVWDPSSGERRHTFDGVPDDGPLPLFLAAAGERFASVWSDGALIAGDLASGQAIPGLDKAPRASSGALDGAGERVAIGGSRGAIEIWGLAPAKRLVALKKHDKAVTALAFSTDGKLLVSGSEDKLIKVWDLARKQELRVLSGHTRAIDRLLVHPDGTRLISFDEGGAIKVWRLDDGALLHAIAAHKKGVTSACLGPDGRTLLTTGADRSLALWDLDSGARLAADQAPEDLSACAFVAPDQIACGDEDGGVTFLRLVAS